MRRGFLGSGSFALKNGDQFSIRHVTKATFKIFGRCRRQADGTTGQSVLTCDRENSLAYLSPCAGSLKVEYGISWPRTSLPFGFLVYSSDLSKRPGHGHTYVNSGRPRPFVADKVHRGEFTGHCGLQGDALKSMNVELGAGQRLRLVIVSAHSGQGRGLNTRDMVIASCGGAEMGYYGCFQLIVG